jgi:hypothetical protein
MAEYFSEGGKIGGKAGGKVGGEQKGNGQKGSVNKNNSKKDL